MSRLSIRKQLLTLFVPFLFGLWICSAFLSFWLISKFSSESFDRDLINSSDSVVGRLRMKGNKVVVDLPPAALAILKQTESDKLYYRVIRADGRTISGDAQLPAPSANLQPNVPRVISRKILGKEVRLAEIKVAVEDAPDQTVIVQLAETTNVRSRFQEKMLLSIFVPQLLMTAVGLFAVWYGITRILTPLKSLQQQLASRSQIDLRSLSDDDAPEEVYPLVKALNHLLSRLRDELKANQRFIANAAHQLRTPLAGMKTYSSIGGEMSEVSDLKHIVRQLDQGIDRSSRIVCQLLALARTDSTEGSSTKQLQDTDLNSFVSQVLDELVEQAVAKDIKLTYSPAPYPANIFCDHSGMRHLVANLIENAFSYTPKGGKVVVQISCTEYVSLSVSDSGPGIPLDEREKVFERFYRIVGTSGNGSGLGLAIVKEVANAHNARVSIATGAEGIGTRVSVDFPVA